jgi:predicted lipid-binding transport protein (Tim44 family)
MAEQKPSAPPNFGGWMGSMWLYTTLRFGLFFALWGLLVLVGLHGFIAPLVALLLSVPLSFVLLARPRARFTRQLEARVDRQRIAREQLNAELDPDADDADKDAP